MIRRIAFSGPRRSDRGHPVLPLVMDVTRRQVLGLGVVAFGALRLPSTALARDTGPALFELALPAVPTGRAWHTTRVLEAPQRFDLVGLRWSSGRAQAQVRARARGN